MAQCAPLQCPPPSSASPLTPSTLRRLGSGAYALARPCPTAMPLSPCQTWAWSSLRAPSPCPLSALPLSPPPPSQCPMPCWPTSPAPRAPWLPLAHPPWTFSSPSTPPRPLMPRRALRACPTQCPRPPPAPLRGAARGRWLRSGSCPTSLTSPPTFPLPPGAPWSAAPSQPRKQRGAPPYCPA